MQRPIEVGDIVRSAAGRDDGRELLIIKRLDNEYFLVADGRHRTVEKPKKKKARHLRTTGRCIEEAKVLLEEGNSITNAQIRHWLSYEED